ncbi:type VII secretion-associated serine protease mycosin [Streptomyces sp. CMB-StM0423]|uniref:type VII secretion-associated serine protease mycosin n=1 Tax=Streptomyces sp. CMB-StM0423 TaxID=2059884 RepID=UPI000C70E1C6|nr:type VII secretion-associated serine protease mycosin [Streptomyces sp. CMB-StM0423]AUH43955.1 type VII secretion-associated serine protease mycosin [Streptomyces sp. CMB-StM0423]
MTRPFPVRRRAAALLAALAATTLLAATAAPAHADGLQDLQWGLDDVRAPEAWNTTRGEGVTVAVLDTGVDASHPDLTGQVLDGKDFVGFGARRGDDSWARHGTAMAGIIAAHGHGPGAAEGVTGVAPDAKILPVRVILEDGDAQRGKARETRGSALADGIRWAVDNGADVINLSLGDDSKSAHPEPGEDAAVQYALRKGVTVVSSAGNSGEKGDRISYPAAYPGVIAVTAVDRTGARAEFSTKHWYATVSAPGVDVAIADPDRTYYEGWGTSAAAAFVSGVTALVRAANPDLTPWQIRDLLRDTAQDPPEGGRSDELGAGRLDAAAAVAAARELQSAPQEPRSAAYDEKRFGSAPALVATEDDGPNGLALAAGVIGVGLIAGAWFLWRGPRSRAAGVRRGPEPPPFAPRPAGPPRPAPPPGAAGPRPQGGDGPPLGSSGVAEEHS